MNMQKSPDRSPAISFSYNLLNSRNLFSGGGGGGGTPYKRLIGMCRWMGSHFHDGIDYNGKTIMGRFSVKK